MAIQFNKHAEEANLFIKELAITLGHPNDIGRAGILLCSVLHTLRDSISLRESIQLIAQLPVFLKGVYVDNWKYSEHPEKLTSVKEFKDRVKQKQDEYGENDFDWPLSTEDLIRKVLEQLSQYISEGEAKEIIDQLSSEVKTLFREGLLSQN